VGLNLTAKGVLSGSLGKSVALGRVNARVQVTEVVTTVVKGKKVTTTTSVKATIPLEVT
jgi:glycine cleavage system aminomethyltransferase T